MSDDISAMDLYGLPLEDFTAHRNDLARRLRAADETEEAARVAALRKPTTDAWAINQVVRSRADLIEDLVATHETMRAAQDLDTAREASQERRRLVDEILAVAVKTLEGAGHSASGTIKERMSLTLLAAGGDRDAEDALRSGTLDRPLEVSSQWPTMGFAAAPPTAVDPEKEKELSRLEARAEELAEQAAVARRQAEEAREVLTEARRRSQEADEAAGEAEKRAREAERAWRAARRST